MHSSFGEQIKPKSLIPISLSGCEHKTLRMYKPRKGMASNELELCVLRKYISHKLNKWQIFMLTINNKSTAPKAIILKSSTLSNTSRNTHTHTVFLSHSLCKDGIPDSPDPTRSSSNSSKPHPPLSPH